MIKAVTLAKLELKGRDSFTPKFLLPPAKQALFRDGVVKANLQNATMTKKTTMRTLTMPTLTKS